MNTAQLTPQECWDLFADDIGLEKNASAQEVESLGFDPESVAAYLAYSALEKTADAILEGRMWGPEFGRMLALVDPQSALEGYHLVNPELTKTAAPDTEAKLLITIGGFTPDFREGKIASALLPRALDELVKEAIGPFSGMGLLQMGGRALKGLWGRGAQTAAKVVGRGALGAGAGAAAPAIAGGAAGLAAAAPMAAGGAALAAGAPAAMRAAATRGLAPAAQGFWGTLKGLGSSAKNTVLGRRLVAQNRSVMTGGARSAAGSADNVLTGQGKEMLQSAGKAAPGSGAVTRESLEQSFGREGKGLITKGDDIYATRAGRRTFAGGGAEEATKRTALGYKKPGLFNRGTNVGNLENVRGTGQIATHGGVREAIRGGIPEAAMTRAGVTNMDDLARVAGKENILVNPTNGAVTLTRKGSDRLAASADDIAASAAKKAPKPGPGDFGNPVGNMNRSGMVELDKNLFQRVEAQLGSGAARKSMSLDELNSVFPGQFTINNGQVFSAMKPNQMARSIQHHFAGSSALPTPGAGAAGGGMMDKLQAGVKKNPLAALAGAGFAGTMLGNVFD
jgi:hypothetical protein